MRLTPYILVALLLTCAITAPAQTLTPMEQLGKQLFFDDDLSSPKVQSCASCHDPAAGFTSPDSFINQIFGPHQGALPWRFSARKPPTAAYAGFSPTLHFDVSEGLWLGGVFFDGRATGLVLGDPIAEQALGPFLNPLEQNLKSKKQVLRRIRRSSYAPLFRQVWGPNSLRTNRNVVDANYDNVGRAIAAYERSTEVNPFSSKYDAYLAGQATLTALEMQGLQLFEGAAMCNACHPSQPGPNGEPPLFTDFSYDNLGIPRNQSNPFYFQARRFNPDGYGFVDYGLGAFLEAEGYPSAVYLPELGKVKVPTLRNVDKRPYPGFVKAYGHNGFFKSLIDITHFYNTRDLPGEGWAPPEVPMNVNTSELGDLGLTLQEELAIVEFMKTLTDGYFNP